MPTRDQTTLELLASAIGEKYEVLHWIGGGGMAEVFLAQHRVTGGQFAVKVLADHLAHDQGIVDRFLQEARTAAALSGHANIVSIFDIGDREGLHYLIMQYVEGEDVAACLGREGPLNPVTATQIIMQVAKALVWAHSKGVVHRDLKPANIRLDRYGRVIVLDFGIAKAKDLPTALTTTGERLGTPYYMSPEQVRGEPCDGRSDLYSLGIVFYELLIGRRPFEGDSCRAIEFAHLSTPAPSPSLVNPAIEEKYCRVVLRLLEKDPAQRYQTAMDLLEDLKPLDAGHGTVAIQLPDQTRPSSDLQPTATARVEPPPTEPQAPKPFIPAPTPLPTGGPPAALPAAAPEAYRQEKPKNWLVLGGAVAVVAVALAVALAMFLSHGSHKAIEAAPQPEKAATRTAEQPSALAAQISTPAGAMQLVPAGNFTFGDASKESPNPLRTIFLPDFYVDTYEVSNAAYKQFCEATGHALPEAPPWDAGYFSTKPNYPAVDVSLEEAKAFAAWAGKRLPSEEEWEKAARGADGRMYPWGNAAPARQANLAGAADGFEYTAPVDAFPEGGSPSGARNMAGNVWEWTADSYPVTPREIADMKAVLRSVGKDWAVIKGGNFTSDELWLRTYMRRGFPQAAKSPYIGFRCVKDAK